MPRPALPWGLGGLHLIDGGGLHPIRSSRPRRRMGLTRPPDPWSAAAVVAFDPVLAVQCSIGHDRDVRGLPRRRDPGRRHAERARKGRSWAGSASAWRASAGPASSPPRLSRGRSRLVVGPGRLERPGVARAGLLTASRPSRCSTPWAWRNARIFGEPVWSTTHGGYTLALANNPVYYAEVLDGPAGRRVVGTESGRLVR